MRGILRGAAGGEELLQHVGLTQVVVGRNDTAERAPRIRVHAEPAAQSLGFPAVHHLESERELLPELFLPLPAQRRRSEDQDALDAAAEQKLGEDEPCLDGLAEPDIVGDEKADAWHSQRLEEGHDLVALDAHTPMEGARDRLPRGRSFAAGGVEIGGERSPTCGTDERIEIFRRHGAAGVGRIRKGVRLVQTTVRLDLPENAFFGRCLIVLVFEVDKMETPGLAVEGLDGRDDSAAVADGREHPGAGNGGGLRGG